MTQIVLYKTLSVMFLFFGAISTNSISQAQQNMMFEATNWNLKAAKPNFPMFPKSGEDFAPVIPGTNPTDPDSPWCYLTGPCGKSKDKILSELYSDGLTRAGYVKSSQSKLPVFEALGAARTLVSKTPVNCPNPMNLPAKAAGDLCNPSKMTRVAECSKAARRLMDYRVVDTTMPAEGDNYRWTPIEIIKRFGGPQSAPVIMKWYSDDIIEYLEKCLRPLPELGNSIEPGEAKAIASRIGIFYRFGRRHNVCVATYIDGRFFTARHCLLDSAGKLTENMTGFIFKSQNELLQHEFTENDTLISTEYYQRKGSKGHFHSFRTTDDIVAIKTRENLLNSPSIPIGTLQRGDQLLITGYNSNSVLPALISASMEFTNTHNPASTYYFDDSPICMIVEVNKDRCIQHACQTENQMSGSPIFVRRSDGVKFVGVHNTGRNIEGSSNCWKKNVSKYLSNNGVAIARELISQ